MVVISLRRDVKDLRNLLGLCSKIAMYLDQDLYFWEEHTEHTQEYCFLGHTWKTLLHQRVGQNGKSSQCTYFSSVLWKKEL